jgi:hypothetical protein
MWTQFVSADTNRGLSLDGLRNSHPIEVAVENPAQIRELFDAISYSKGAATLRMIEAFLGEDDFAKVSRPISPRTSTATRTEAPGAPPAGIRSASYRDHEHLDQTDGLSAPPD